MIVPFLNVLFSQDRNYTLQPWTFSDTGFAATVIAVIGTIVFGVDHNFIIIINKIITP